jgi:hypothetical protein
VWFERLQTVKLQAGKLRPRAQGNDVTSGNPCYLFSGTVIKVRTGGNQVQVLSVCYSMASFQS